MSQIYLDNAAGTAQIVPHTHYYNPASPHKLGLISDRALESARQSLISLTRAGRLIFTSGGTEALNLAIFGFAILHKNRDATIYAQGHEHPAVLGPLKFVQEMGYATVKICPPDRWDVSGTALYCFTHICHETGHMPDIAAQYARLKAANPNGFVLVDGAQGFLKAEIPPYDIYTISAHKAHGPAGVGAVSLAKGMRLMPTMHGGPHESAMRAGSQNVPGICSFVDAAKQLAPTLDERGAHIAGLHKMLAQLADTLPGTHINTVGSGHSPYIISMSFDGVVGETLVSMLSERDVFASYGAACRVRGKKSPLIDMGFSQERARSAVRFSFSHLNTRREISAAAKIIAQCVADLRTMSG